MQILFPAIIILADYRSRDGRCRRISQLLPLQTKLSITYHLIQHGSWML